MVNHPRMIDSLVTSTSMTGIRAEAALAEHQHPRGLATCWRCPGLDCTRGKARRKGLLRHTCNVCMHRSLLQLQLRLPISLFLKNKCERGDSVAMRVHSSEEKTVCWATKPELCRSSHPRTTCHPAGTSMYDRPYNTLSYSCHYYNPSSVSLGG